MDQTLTRRMICIGLSLMAFGFVLSGCHAPLLTYKGEKVREAYRIVLSEGTLKNAQYSSSDLSIDYHAFRSGDELQLSGTVKYTPKITNNYVSIPHFHLILFLTDQYGNVLQENGINTPGSNDPNKHIRFKEKIKLPAGTANMAFGYNGEAHSGGRQDRGGTTPFWEIPIIR